MDIDTIHQDYCLNRNTDDVLFLDNKKKICRQFCLFQHIYTIILIYMQGSKFYRQTLRSDKDK